MEMGMDMEYNLIIKDFGKIKEADIHVSPLTLFVGDNNSGKSYLMSLIWALRSLTTSSPLFHGIKRLEHPALQKIKEQLTELIEKGKSQKTAISEFSSEYFIDVFNTLCEHIKDTFVSTIFNDPKIHIGSLKIYMPNTAFTVRFHEEASGKIMFQYGAEQQGIIFPDSILNEKMVESFCTSVICWLLGSNLGHNTYFLPAARTGFMLSKTMINQYSRKYTFDVIPHKEDWINVTNSAEPLTKPILHFLDTLELVLSNENTGKQKYLAQWIEKEMIHGSIIQSNGPGQEIRYMPIESKESLSLRTSSAVVTELIPLILLLKNEPLAKFLCYEEPEMCLHPQLQYEMGKVLIRIVNSGVNIIVTTHSDIIMQHINNMCRLSSIKERKELLERFNLIDDDLINTSQVAVYQLKDCGNYSTVEEIKPNKNGFEIPTFYDALMSILEQTTDIQDAVTEQEA